MQNPTLKARECHFELHDFFLIKKFQITKILWHISPQIIIIIPNVKSLKLKLDSD
jgi:hypothetical protein